MGELIQITIQLLIQLTFCLIFSFFIKKQFPKSELYEIELTTESSHISKLDWRGILKGIQLQTLMLHEDRIFNFIKEFYIELSKITFPFTRKYLLLTNLAWSVILLFYFFYQLIVPNLEVFMLFGLTLYFAFPILLITIFVEKNAFKRNEVGFFLVWENNIKPKLSQKQIQLLYIFPFLYLLTIQMRVIHLIFRILLVNRKRD